MRNTHSPPHPPANSIPKHFADTREAPGLCRRDLTASARWEGEGWRGETPLQGEPGGRSLGRWEVSAAEDAEGGKEKGEQKKKNQMELEVTREVEEGKGEEGEEEGVKGEWEADEEGCSPSPGELEGGQPEDRLQGGYKRQDRDAEGPAASAQPRGDAPRSFAGSAENSLPKQPSRSGDAASHAPESAGAQGQLRMVPSLRPALLLLLLLQVRCFKSSSPVRALLPPPHHPSALHRRRPPQ